MIATWESVFDKHVANLVAVLLSPTWLFALVLVAVIVLTTRFLAHNLKFIQNI